MRACRIRSRPSRSGVPGRDQPHGGEHGFGSRLRWHRRRAFPAGLRGTAWWCERPKIAHPNGAAGDSPAAGGRHGAARTASAADRGLEAHLERDCKVAGSQNLQAGDGGERGRPDDPGEPEPRGLAEAPGSLRNLPQLTAEADFAKCDRGARNRTIERAPATRNATARSTPASATRAPPATLAYTSAPPTVTPRVRSSTASNIASRPASSPCAALRGMDVALGATRACTSTSIGREPSSTGATTDPEAPVRLSARNIAEASATSARPCSLMSKRPSSSVEPKRCFERVEHAQ